MQDCCDFLTSSLFVADQLLEIDMFWATKIGVDFESRAKAIPELP